MGRFFEPQTIDETAIEAVIASGRTPVVQYSHPAYPDAVLGAVDRACRRFGEALEVRFFAHRGQPFEGRILGKIPNVANLSLDTLTSIADVQVVGELRQLRRLRFGVYQLDSPDILRALGVERLTRLSLAENRKRNFDLAPLADAKALTHLFVQGHSKNIEAVTSLTRLEDLSLSGFPARRDLAFANRIAALRRLFLILGSRESLEELDHPGLEDLRVVWVKTLAALGPLGRFPRLRRFALEDQLHLSSIDVAGAPLERLRISNCKSLSRIDGLETLDRLRAIMVDRTAIDLDALADRPWPSSLRAIVLWGGSRARNRAIRERLDARGYRETLAGSEA